MTRPPARANLVIGAISDKLERDADRRAEQALALPAGAAARRVPSSRSDVAATASQPVSSSVSQVVASAGAPLAPGPRQDMEQRFGEDFSHVRIHTDAAAARSAAEVGARAYAVGSHIVFGERSSPSDRRLLAHELAHVVQGAGQSAVLRRQPDPKGPHTDPAGARLGVKIVDTLTATKETAYNALLSALNRGDRAYLQALGLSPKEVGHLLNRTANLNMTFGRAAELAVEHAIRADALLSQHIIRGPQGRVPRRVGKPDWIMETPSGRIPVELTTPAEVERKLQSWRKQTRRGKPKWYMEKGLVITHGGPPAVSPPSRTVLEPDAPPAATPQLPQAAAKTSVFRTAARFVMREGPGLALQAVGMLLFPPGVTIRNDKSDELVRTKLNPAIQAAIAQQEPLFDELLSAGVPTIYANVTAELQYTVAASQHGLDLYLKDITLREMTLTNKEIVRNDPKFETRDPGSATKRVTYSFRVYESEFAAREREWAEAQQEARDYQECVERYGAGRTPHAAGTDIPQPNPEDGLCIPPRIRPGY